MNPRFFRPRRSRGPALDAEVREEVETHVGMWIDFLVARGVPRDEANRQARARFGEFDVALADLYFSARHREDRIDRRERWHGLVRDVVFAIRQARRERVFTIVALLTFALGIGANTAVFSVVSTILLRPLPFAAPELLTSIWPGKTISNAELEFMQQNAKTFASVAALSPGWGIALTGSGEPRQLDGARVSTNYFRTLGAAPALGRTFADGESSAGAWNVAVLSHALWVSQFAGDPGVIDRIVQMDGTPHRIIGVMPASLEALWPGVDAWLPLEIDRTSRFYTGQTALAFGRLAPGVSMAIATAEMALLAPRMRAAFHYADDYGRGARVISMHEALVGDVRTSLLVLFGAATFVVLIAGANVGNLMLVHAAGRRREMAVRRALGASRARIARQLFVQSLLIATTGGVLGTIAGTFGVRLLKEILPASLPMLAMVSVDRHVLLVSASITVGLGLLFGIAPALFATRVDPDGTLRTATSTAGNLAGARTRQTLVVAEIALAMVLVVGAGLMTESLWRLSKVDVGFDATHVLSFRLQPSSGQVNTAAQISSYFDDLTHRFAAIPGVESVGASQHLPLTGYNWRGDLEIEKRPTAPTATRPRVVWRSIVGDYFGAMRIPVLRGRAFNVTDTRDAPAVIIINDKMAKTYWPTGDPLGERIQIGNGSRNDWATIVGVVGSVRFESPQTPPGDEVYRPNTQQGLVSMHFVVRTRGAPLKSVAAVRSAVRAVDGTVPIAQVRALDELFSASTATPRTIAALLLGFAGIGLMLGAVGIYGVISFAVGQRTRELGVRAALGAIEARIVTMVLAEGVRLAMIGIVCGAVAATVATRALRTLVFGVATTDAATYIGVAGVLVAVTLGASYFPARRAARIDPLLALRQD